MSKIKKKFVCQSCGYESPKLWGKCPECEQWNTFIEEFEHSSNKKSKVVLTSEPQDLRSIDVEEKNRLRTNMKEINRVLGGGIIPGSLILIGGDPGIGKSTILLQMARDLMKKEIEILYVSGEESAKQIKLRADRMSIGESNIKILAETNMPHIMNMIEKYMPSVLMIDSIQTMYNPDITSAPGSVSQVREITNQLMNISKKKNISTIIVGHVTKQGAIAGPRVLEHMVDTVLYFEGERHNTYRILRAVKNRFGSTNEIGIFEMSNIGLIEVENPSKIILEGRPVGSSGSVVIPCMEGTRPLMIEIQALASESKFGVPRRMSAGIDYNRVVLLIAMMEKRLGMMLYSHDIYVNVIGGIKVDEPAADLGIITSIASSFRDIPIAPDITMVGEIGLTGEIRNVSNIDKRIMEAKKLGFNKILIPKGNINNTIDKSIEIIGIRTLREAFDIIFK